MPSGKGGTVNITLKTNTINHEIPTLYFAPHAWSKMNTYIAVCGKEVAGFGVLDKVDNGFVVSDVFIVEQEVSDGHADIDSNSLASLAEKFIAEGKEDYLGKMNMWWHSHVMMEAFFSTRDVTTINKWPDTDYLISVVGNKKGEFSCRLDLWRPFRMAVDMPMAVGLSMGVEEMEALKKEVEDKVTVNNRVIVVSKGRKKGYQKSEGGYKEYRESFRRAGFWDFDDWDDEYGYLLGHDDEDKECCSDMGCCGLLMPGGTLLEDEG